MQTLHSYCGHPRANTSSEYSLYNTSLRQKVSPICWAHYPLGTSYPAVLGMLLTARGEANNIPGKIHTPSINLLQLSIWISSISDPRVNSTKNDARPFIAPNIGEASSWFICLADTLSRPHLRSSIWKVKVREAHYYFARANVQKEFFMVLSLCRIALRSLDIEG